MSTVTPAAGVVVVRIPTLLRGQTDGKPVLHLQAGTVAEALRQLVGEHAGVEPYLYDDAGRFRTFVNVYVNDEDVRYLDREATPLRPGDTLSIVPAVAGG